MTLFKQDHEFVAAMRATVSQPCTDRSRRVAARSSKRSPAAWPRSSLMFLKLSMFE